jgi:hypothetical protein
MREISQIPLYQVFCHFAKSPKLFCVMDDDVMLCGNGIIWGDGKIKTLLPPLPWLKYLSPFIFNVDNLMGNFHTIIPKFSDLLVCLASFSKITC